MEHHNNIEDHSNLAMMLISVLVSVTTYLGTSAISGELLHLASALAGAILVFLAQKLMHHLWDKYITKRKKNDKSNS